MVKKMYILDDYSAAFTIIKVTLYPIVCFASTRLWIVLADKSCTAGFYFHERVSGSVAQTIYFKSNHFFPPFRFRQ